MTENTEATKPDEEAAAAVEKPAAPQEAQAEAEKPAEKPAEAAAPETPAVKEEEILQNVPVLTEAEKTSWQMYENYGTPDTKGTMPKEHLTSRVATLIHHINEEEPEGVQRMSREALFKTPQFREEVTGDRNKDVISYIKDEMKRIEDGDGDSSTEIAALREKINDAKARLASDIESATKYAEAEGAIANTLYTDYLNRMEKHGALARDAAQGLAERFAREQVVANGGVKMNSQQLKHILSQCEKLIEGRVTPAKAKEDEKAAAPAADNKPSKELAQGLPKHSSDNPSDATPEQELNIYNGWDGRSAASKLQELMRAG